MNKIVKYGLIGAVLTGLGLGAYRYWDDLTNSLARWARQRNYRGLVRFTAWVENVRAGLYRVTVKFLGLGSREMEPETVAIRELQHGDLPPQFRDPGRHELTMEL